MTSTTFFFVFIPILAIILLLVNLIFAPHNPYQEKNSAFECGFHSFLGQNRTQFSISFFIFALLFLLFDLEILLVYPYVVSAYANGIYGLVIMLIFFLVLTLGFAFELGKNALNIDSRQMISFFSKKDKSLFSVLSTFLIFNKIKSKLRRVITLDKLITLVMILLGIILGRVLLNLGFIPLDLKKFIFALCEPLNISGALLLS
jgi:NADH-ubiquinone oxidoreductase chain 3